MGMPNSYAEVLSDLRAKRQQIDTAIEAIEGLMPQPLVLAVDPHSPNGSLRANPEGERDDATGPYAALTIADASKRVMAIKGRGVRNLELVDALEDGGLLIKSADKANTVNSVLTRRAKSAGDVIRMKRGVWGLAEWMPQQPTFSADETEPDHAEENSSDEFDDDL